MTPAPDTPIWLLGCAGLSFVRMGAILIVSFAVAPGRGPVGGDTSGRIMFGIGAVLMWLLLVSAGVTGARSLWRDRHRCGALRYAGTYVLRCAAT